MSPTGDLPAHHAALVPQVRSHSVRDRAHPSYGRHPTRVAARQPQHVKRLLLAQPVSGAVVLVASCPVITFGQPETTPWRFFLILGGGSCKGNWLLLLRTLSVIVGLSLVAGHLPLVNVILICFAAPCSPLQPFFLLSLTDVGQEAAQELAQIQDSDLASSTGELLRS